MRTTWGQILDGNLVGAGIIFSRRTRGGTRSRRGLLPWGSGVKQRTPNAGRSGGLGNKRVATSLATHGLAPNLRSALICFWQ